MKSENPATVGFRHIEGDLAEDLDWRREFTARNGRSAAGESRSIFVPIFVDEGEHHRAYWHWALRLSIDRNREGEAREFFARCERSFGVAPMWSLHLEPEVVVFEEGKGWNGACF